jgi:hypothetical protein
MRAALAFVALGALAAAGCSTQRITPAPAPPTETVDGLRQRPEVERGAVFVAQPPPDWGRFRRVVVELPRIEYAARSARPTGSDERRLREQLRTTLTQVFAEALGWQPAEAGAADLVRLRSQISDLELSAPPVSAVRTTAFQAPSGSAGFVLELEDAARGVPLLRFAERRPLPGGTFVGPPWTELQRTREAFRRFALDARSALAGLDVARAAE